MIDTGLNRSRLVLCGLGKNMSRGCCMLEDNRFVLELFDLAGGGGIEVVPERESQGECALVVVRCSG
jgi:hypothetical protein